MFLKSTPSLTLFTRHAYHLIDPSSWPLLASSGVFMLTLGLVAWMHSFTGGWGLFAHGLIVIMYIASVWWEDVIRELTFEEQHKAVVRRGLQFGMILFIISEIMFFFAFFWAFLHSSLSTVFNISDSAFGSCFYMTTGFHGFHVLVGTIALCVFATFCTYNKTAIGAPFGRIIWLCLLYIFKHYQPILDFHGLGFMTVVLHAFIEYSYISKQLYRLYTWAMGHSGDDIERANDMINEYFPDVNDAAIVLASPSDDGDEEKPPIQEAVVVILGVVVAVGAFIVRILLFR